MRSVEKTNNKLTLLILQWLQENNIEHKFDYQYCSVDYITLNNHNLITVDKSEAMVYYKLEASNPDLFKKLEIILKND